MRRLTLLAICLTATIGTGCQSARRTLHSPPPCGKAHISCGASSEESEGFGLFGKAFCDRRLSEGTAFVPWQYAYNLCLAGSQFSNTVLGGDPDESLSSRFGRAEEDGIVPIRYALAPVTNVLVGPDHCRRCIEHEEPRNKELWSW
jgi:hypothetical protein